MSIVQPTAREISLGLREEARFHDSLLLGNGSMGAAVFGQSRLIRVNLNRSDIWDYRYGGLDIEGFSYTLAGELVRREAWQDLACLKDACMRAYMRPYPGYAPAGELQIACEGPECDATAKLSLDSGVVDVNWDPAGRMRSFVSAHSDVLALSFSGIGPRSIHMSLERQPNDEYPAPALCGGEGVGSFVFTFPDGFQYAIALVGPGWDFGIEEDRLVGRPSSDGTEAECYTAIATSNDGDDPMGLAVAAAERAAREGWSALLDRQRMWWGDFWERSDLSLPDADLERAWRAQMYQLGCCSRPGKLPPNLQGIWNATDYPDWHSNWTFDLNVQITAWPLFTANHSDLALPFAEFYETVLPEIERQTRLYWGLPGAKFGSACDPNGREFFGYLTASYWAGSSAWALEPVIWYFRNTRDLEFARTVALPLLESALDFYSAFLQTGLDGRIHVPLTTSPESWENGDEAWGNDATLDLAALRQLARAALEMYDSLGEAGRHAAYCRDLLGRLADYPLVSGVWSELEGKSYPEPHRHLSVLSPIYPTAEMHVDEESRRIAIASYRAFVNRGPVADWGCTLSWLSMVASRLGLVDDALEWLRRARRTLGRTYLHQLRFETDDWKDEPGRTIYEIDGGAGFAAALNEMLLSSLGGKLRLFPTVPVAWSCSFRDFRAEGGHLVTSEFTGGRIGPTSITSTCGSPCSLERTGRWTSVSVQSEQRNVALQDDGRIVRFDTDKGARYDVTFA